MAVSYIGMSPGCPCCPPPEPPDPPVDHLPCSTCPIPKVDLLAFNSPDPWQTNDDCPAGTLTLSYKATGCTVNESGLIRFLSPHWVGQYCAFAPEPGISPGRYYRVWVVLGCWEGLNAGVTAGPNIWLGSDSSLTAASIPGSCGDCGQKDPTSIFGGSAYIPVGAGFELSSRTPGGGGVVRMIRHSAVCDPLDFEFRLPSVGGSFQSIIVTRS